MNTHVTIAPQGPTLSRFVTGVWRWAELSSSSICELIEKSIEVGITTFDHADIYGDYTCETLFGEAFANTSAQREQVQLVSKCGIRLLSKNRPENTLHCYDTSTAHIIASAERSLKNLRTDYLDVLLIHRPSPLMDADAIAEAFTQLEDTGKVRYFGVSNFTPAQFTLLQSRFPNLVTNQVEISPLALSAFTDGTLDQLQQHKIAPMAWSPLGGGALFKEAATPKVERLQAIFKQLAAKYEASIDQLVFAWLLQPPSHILPILGTTQPVRIEQATRAFTLRLTNEEWFEIWVASTGTEVP